MRSLGVFVFTSVGAGYVALNSIPSELNLELLEFCPLGHHAQILVLGDQENIRSFSKILHESDLIKTHIIQNIHRMVLDAYFSLINNKIQKAILIVESQYVGDLILVGNKAVSCGSYIVDLRFPRVPEALGHLILTADNTEELLQIREELHERSISSRFIREVSAQFRDFFEIRST